MKFLIFSHHTNTLCPSNIRCIINSFHFVIVNYTILKQLLMYTSPNGRYIFVYKCWNLPNILYVYILTLCNCTNKHKYCIGLYCLKYKIKLQLRLFRVCYRFLSYVKFRIWKISNKKCISEYTKGSKKGVIKHW